MKQSFSPDSELILLMEKASSDLGFSPEGWQATLLQGDGSDRKFFRLRRGASHFVALISPRRNANGTDENDSYFLIGKHLSRHHLPVPEILWADPDRGYFLLQDLGDCHLQKHLRRGAVPPYPAYRNAIRLLAQLHRRTPKDFDPSYCFDTALYDPSFVYEREPEYFRKSFLGTYLGLETAKEDLRRDFENLSEAAGVRETTQILHRDFQSRNLMLCRGGLWIIDFQGMRFGPSVYDLASLLLDPYVMLPMPLQAKLVDLYWSAAQGDLNCSYRRFFDKYRFVRLCRNLQVLGAYGYLGVTLGKTQFLRYIPGAFRQLCHWMEGPCKGQFPTLEKWVRRARKILEEREP